MLILSSIYPKQTKIYQSFTVLKILGKISAKLVLILDDSNKNTLKIKKINLQSFESTYSKVVSLQILRMSVIKNGISFFIYHLAGPWMTLSHCQGDSLLHLMLITVLYFFICEDHQEPFGNLLILMVIHFPKKIYVNCQIGQLSLNCENYSIVHLSQPSNISNTAKKCES